ncbi:hypothetical protein BHS07_09035 [Myxococcus xanthus]|nr:hypothetical protein BHS07_09035 [Myxococcus xanthus]
MVLRLICGRRVLATFLLIAGWSRRMGVWRWLCPKIGRFAFLIDLSMGRLFTGISVRLFLSE